jgi:hypothetical protein
VADETLFWIWKPSTSVIGVGFLLGACPGAIPQDLQGSMTFSKVNDLEELTRKGRSYSRWQKNTNGSLGFENGEASGKWPDWRINPEWISIRMHRYQLSFERWWGNTYNSSIYIKKLEYRDVQKKIRSTNRGR